MIAEHVYSSRFGTFIVNSEREREKVRAGSVILSKFLVYFFFIHIMMLNLPTLYK